MDLMVLRSGGSLLPAMLAALATGLLLAALYQIAGAAMIYGKAWLAPHLIERAYKRSQHSGEAIKPWPWADTHPVAQLRVPRLGLTRYILSGQSGHALAFAAGLAPDVRPGDPGLAMLSGHRDTHFRFLSRLQTGDELFLSFEGREYRYQVTEQVVADARDGRIDARLPPRGMLLVTCYPFDAVVPGGPLRYVIVTEQLAATDGGNVVASTTPSSGLVRGAPG